MRECIKEAKSVDEAISLACKELGVERDAIEFEIINLPKRGFFGLRNTPARVRVYFEEPVKEEKKPERLQPSEKPARASEPKPVQEPKPAKSSRPAKPEKPLREERQQLSKETVKEPPVKKEPKPEKKENLEAKPEESKKRESAPLVFVRSDEVEGKAKTAVTYLKGVLAEMNVYPEIAVARTENGVILRLSGEGLGVIIGRRGETLDSLQYLCGLVANREEGDYMRVTIDSGNYREKRERTLEHLAQKISASAIRYGRSSTLEPMNPYERRIIHATVSKIEGVSSTSIGEEPNRRVVITPDNLKPQQGRRGGKGGGRGGKPPRRGDGPRSGERREFPPRDRDSGRRDRDRNDRGRRDGGRRDETIKPTPTSIDREYLKEIEQEGPSFVKSAPSEKPAAPVRENLSALRTQKSGEGADLPLYGKIEL